MTDDVRTNLDALASRKAALMFEVVRTTPFLSVEGKRERMRYLMKRGRVKLTFEVG